MNFREIEGGSVRIRLMRPLFHPAAEDITVEGILHALADPVRVEIYKDLASKGCPKTCTEFLAVSTKPIPKSTLSQHYKVLREAGLIRSVRNGIEMHNTARCEELEARFPGLVFAIVLAHNVQSVERRQAAQSGPAKAVDIPTKTEKPRVTRTSTPATGIPKTRATKTRPS
jgi:DNA-binding transcriptional ArsR family regulator